MIKQAIYKLLGLTLAAAMAFSATVPVLAAGRSDSHAALSTAVQRGGITQTALPNQDWQAVVSFPDWCGYVDDTLVMNSLYSFTGFSGQGALYVTVAEGVTGFRMFVNNAEVDAAAMTAGGTWKLDISDLSVDGTNTIQVTNITPASLSGAVTVHIPYPVVIEGIPEQVGMDESTVQLIGDYVEAEVKYGFSGAQLAVVKDGKLVVNEAWGAVNGYNPDGSRIEVGDENYVPVTTDTLYDLASNTKMYSVNYALQYLVDRGQIDLDAHITDFYPEFDDEGKTIYKEGTTEAQKAQILAWKSELTIRDILMHQAGFDPDPQYHNDQFDQVTQKPAAGVSNPLFSQDRATTLEKVLASPLTYEPGSKTVYSDVDYMLLCFIIEKVTGKGLDVFLKETFWTPMGLEHMTYNPLQNGFEKNDCAATELNGNTRDGAISFQNVRTDTVQGEVHDEKAYYAMGGISGHAGLFSNAEDLAKLASVMLTGGYGEHRFFSKNTIDEFTKAKSLSYPTWGLGWWRQGEIGRVSYFTTHASGDTIGHQGWTGTLTVIDPDNNLVVVLLTNKKNSPVIDNTVDTNDFYSDNLTLGGLGSVVGYVYEAFNSTPDAMDASLMQFAKERIKLMSSHKNAYDEAPHMNDSFALTDLVVTRAERRQSQVTVDYAQTVLDDLKGYVQNYVAKTENQANAAAWTEELQARIDAISVTDAAPAAPAMTAVAVDVMPGLNSAGNFAGGQDQNAVYFPRWGSGTTSYCYNNSITWFEGFAGQGTVYFQMRRAVPSMRIFINGVEVDTSAMLNTTGKFAIDVSAYTVNGRNSVQVTDMPIETSRLSVLMVVTNPEVVEGTPEEVGLDEKALNLIDGIIRNDVEQGFTSAQMAVVKDGKLVYSNAWGTVNAYNPDGTPKTDSPAVTTETLYDLASNTKMYATNYAVQYLVKEGLLNLSDKITKFFPSFAEDTVEIHYQIWQGTGAPDLETAKAWKAELTVADILQHQAGFAPDPQFHNDQFDQVTQTPAPGVENILYAIGSEEVAKAICKAPLVYEPGTKTVYSDVDYMLLGLIVEQVTGEKLDEFLQKTFYGPLNLTHVTFNPLDHGFTADQVAATELNGNTRDGVISFKNVRTDTIQGEVHDEKAYYAMGGVSGHAGLFANAEDLAKLASLMINQSGYGSSRLFDYNTNQYFMDRKDSSATWGQGWWRQGDCGRPWYFGVQASRDTVGHQGWTGTLTVVDPAENLVIVYLTNKINSPVTDNTVAPNQFDGNWYTSSTLGFVANILYQGLNGHSASEDIQPALDALLGDMIVEKMRLVDDENTMDPDHPVVKSAYALAELIFDTAEDRPTQENLDNARTALECLDAVRDADLIAILQDRLEKLDPSYLLEQARAARDAAEAAQKAAEEAQAAAETARAAAEAAAAEAGENSEAAKRAAEEAEAAQAKAEEARSAAEIAQKAAEDAAAAAESSNQAAAEEARKAAEEAAAAAKSAAEAATSAAASAEAMEKAQAAQKAAEDAARVAEEARKKAEEAQKAAEEIAASAGENKEYAERAAEEAKAAQEAAEAAQKAAEDAQTAAETAMRAAEASNQEAAEAAALAAAYAQQVAETYAEIVAMKAEMARYLVDAQEAAKVAEEAKQAALEAALTSAKYYALTELSNYAASLDCPEHQAEAMAQAIAEAKTAIEAAQTPEEVEAALTEALAKLDEVVSAKCPSEQFTDVNTGAWYHDSVDYVLTHGLMQGTSDTTFAPESRMTRGQMVTVLYRMEQEPEVTTASSFTDLKPGSYYEDAVNWAAANGIVTGRDSKTFDPNGSVTRQDLVVILFRYAGWKGYDVSARASLESYADADRLSGYAAEAMSWAVAEGIVRGTSATTLSPRSYARRCELATVFMGFLEQFAE